MSARARISLRTKLAAALCLIFAVPHEHAQAMSDDQVLSLAHWDHYPIPKAEGGSDHHSNLCPRQIADHRDKTASIDVPGIAKRKRVARAYANHQAIMAAKATGEQITEARRRGPKIRSRGFSKQSRPLRSGNNLKRKRRHAQ